MMGDLEKELLDKVESADLRLKRAKQHIAMWAGSLAGSVIVVIGINFLDMPFGAYLTITILCWVFIVALVIVGLIGFFLKTEDGWSRSPWEGKRIADKAWSDYLSAPRLPASSPVGEMRRKRYKRVRRSDGTSYLVEKTDD